MQGLPPSQGLRRTRKPLPIFGRAYGTQVAHEKTGDEKQPYKPKPAYEAARKFLTESL
jgi:hypothetical protein